MCWISGMTTPQPHSIDRTSSNRMAGPSALNLLTDFENEGQEVEGRKVGRLEGWTIRPAVKPLFQHSLIPAFHHSATPSFHPSILPAFHSCSHSVRASARFAFRVLRLLPGPGRTADHR